MQAKLKKVSSQSPKKRLTLALVTLVLSSLFSSKVWAVDTESLNKLITAKGSEMSAYPNKTYAPIGFSKDGSKFAFYGQFGSECKLQAGTKVYGIESLSPLEEKKIIPCQPNAIYTYQVIDMSGSKHEGVAALRDVASVKSEDMTKVLNHNKIEIAKNLEVQKFPLSVAGNQFSVKLQFHKKDSPEITEELTDDMGEVQVELVMVRNDGKQKVIKTGMQIDATSEKLNVVGYYQAPEQSKIMIVLNQGQRVYADDFTNENVFVGAQVDNGFNLPVRQASN